MRADSEVWKHLARLWPSVLDKVNWELGNGDVINFWLDKWLSDGRVLTDFCNGNITDVDKSWSVRSMVGLDGGWDVQRIQRWVTSKGVTKILAVEPPKDEYGKDTIQWTSSVHNRFVAADFYHSLRKEDQLGI
ncbi:hypothetical protein K1719_010885 [Acacia pycnantha]|nr:hypothetical protein K1719_010885 [Acacia pycnantha]